MIERSKEWWLKKAAEEEGHTVAAGEGQAGPSAFDWGPAINVIRTSGAPSLAAQAVEALWAKDAALRASEAALAEANERTRVYVDKMTLQGKELTASRAEATKAVGAKEEGRIEAWTIVRDGIQAAQAIGAENPRLLAALDELIGQERLKLAAIRAPQPPEPNPNARVWCDEAHRHTAKCTTCTVCGKAHDGACPSSPPPPSEEPIWKTTVPAIEAAIQSVRPKEPR